MGGSLYASETFLEAPTFEDIGDIPRVPRAIARHPIQHSAASAGALPTALVRLLREGGMGGNRPCSDRCFGHESSATILSAYVQYLVRRTASSRPPYPRHLCAQLAHRLSHNPHNRIQSSLLVWKGQYAHHRTLSIDLRDPQGLPTFCISRCPFLHHIPRLKHPNARCSLRAALTIAPYLEPSKSYSHRCTFIEGSGFSAGHTLLRTSTRVS